MVIYTTRILKFGKMGDKTGWTYIEIPADVANKIKKNYKRSYRVKGKLDNFSIKGVSLLPHGEGKFIMPLKADLRKGIGKKEGAMLVVKLEEDKTEFVFDEDFITCLADDTEAEKFFKTLTGSHQRYFSKWIESAKTIDTKTKRIAMAVNALAGKMGYPEMLRANKGR